jgi:hypothetical protein
LKHRGLAGQAGPRCIRQSLAGSPSLADGSRLESDQGLRTLVSSNLTPAAPYLVESSSGLGRLS